MPGPQDQAAAAPQGGGAPAPETSQQAPPPSAPPSQAPASPLQMTLAKWFQVAKQMAASDPRLAAGAEKVSQGIQEMQTALVTPAQPTPIGQQPQY